eukprot:2684610-Alexandrium_andersonii.AAC.1
MRVRGNIADVPLECDSLDPGSSTAAAQDICPLEESLESAGHGSLVSPSAQTKLPDSSFKRP